MTHDQEQALSYTNEKGDKVQLGGMRKLLSYLTAFIAGVGQITVTLYPDSLANPWPLYITRPLVSSPTFDMECAGGSAIGQRIAVKFASSPVTGTDNSFNLQKVVVVLKATMHLPVRGATA